MCTLPNVVVFPGRCLIELWRIGLFKYSTGAPRALIDSLGSSHWAPSFTFLLHFKNCRRTKWVLDTNRDSFLDGGHVYVLSVKVTMEVEGFQGLSVVDDSYDVYHKKSSTFCNERSQELHGFRPRLCPAGRFLAEPPGNHVMKIGESIKIKSCRPRLAEHGSKDSFNNSGNNWGLMLGTLFQGRKDCKPNPLETLTNGLEGGLLLILFQLLTHHWQIESSLQRLSQSTKLELRVPSPPSLMRSEGEILGSSPISLVQELLSSNPLSSPWYMGEIFAMPMVVVSKGFGSTLMSLVGDVIGSASGSFGLMIVALLRCTCTSALIGYVCAGARTSSFSRRSPICVSPTDISFICCSMVSNFSSCAW